MPHMPPHPTSSHLHARAAGVHYVGPVCDDAITSTNLTCPSGDVIVYISSAFFGRSDATTCPFRDPGAMSNTTCSLDNFRSSLQEQCLGRASCALAAAVSGDPCKGTFKWATVVYTCRQNAPEKGWSISGMGRCVRTCHCCVVEGCMYAGLRVPGWPWWVC